MLFLRGAQYHAPKIYVGVVTSCMDGNEHRADIGDLMHTDAVQRAVAAMIVHIKQSNTMPCNLDAGRSDGSIRQETITTIVSWRCMMPRMCRECIRTSLPCLYCMDGRAHNFQITGKDSCGVSMDWCRRIGRIESNLRFHMGTGRVLALSAKEVIGDKTINMHFITERKVVATLMPTCMCSFQEIQILCTVHDFSTNELCTVQCNSHTFHLTNRWRRVQACQNLVPC